MMYFYPVDKTRIQFIRELLDQKPIHLDQIRGLLLDLEREYHQMKNCVNCDRDPAEHWCGTEEAEPCINNSKWILSIEMHCLNCGVSACEFGQKAGASGYCSGWISKEDQP